MTLTREGRSVRSASVTSPAPPETTAPTRSERLVLHEVGKSFTTSTGEELTVFRGLNLVVKEGEFLSVVGPSGCGKSTLLHLIAGLEAPSRGRISFYGKAGKEQTVRIGIIFQEPALFPWLNVQQNVEFGLKMAGVPRRARHQRVEAMLALVGLSKFTSAYVHQLSGGMKQRVAIARELVLEPAVLLMDEPFAALDAITRRHLQEMLLALWEETRKTIIFVTHSIDEALFLAERIVVFTPGATGIVEEHRLPAARPRDLAQPELARTKKQILAALAKAAPGFEA